jgi:transposase
MWTTANRPKFKRDKRRYPSDLTGEEWAHIEPLIPPAKHDGRKRKVDRREVVNGRSKRCKQRLRRINYVLSTGCQWRYVPKELPPSAGHSTWPRDAEPLAGSAQEHALQLFRPMDLRRHVGEYPSCALCEVRRTNRATLDGGIYLAMNEESSHYSATNDGAPLPLVSVVIPHYNSLATLKNCVSLLDRQTFCRDRFEIIVADNNSSCGMDAVRGAAPAAKVIHANEQGAGPARNAGVAASKGSILAFIDSDCLPNFDWIEKGVAAIQAYDLSAATLSLPVRTRSVRIRSKHSKWFSRLIVNVT